MRESARVPARVEHGAGVKPGNIPVFRETRQAGSRPRSIGRAAVTGRRSDGRGAVRRARGGRVKSSGARRVRPEQC
ncbi:hypothetical protein D1006_04895 [Burkholderia stabilis]|uniref:Uncharacterized protein n=1 Tax=Burkholderia stabilis TaxID=95485 RepID=A0A4Q2AN41_9BURK|nr:hypothetical protein D1006_04895 [Burkholderia stabilis]